MSRDSLRISNLPSQLCLTPHAVQHAEQNSHLAISPAMQNRTLQTIESDQFSQYLTGGMQFDHHCASVDWTLLTVMLALQVGSLIYSVMGNAKPAPRHAGRAVQPLAA
jgi:hypothetical protein